MKGHDDLVIKVDESILNDPSNEIKDSLGYYVNAAAHLLKVLSSDKKLRSSELFKFNEKVLDYFHSEPANRRDRNLARIRAEDISVLGTVGKVLWYLDITKDYQLRKELLRLANERNALVGNYFLFYLAGTMAAKGFAVTFVLEQGKNQQKTPDFLAEKNGRRIWIEANAKQPTLPVNTPEGLKRLIRDIIGEKCQKFTNPKFSPGMIVADISTVDYLMNEGGTNKGLRMRRNLMKPFGTASDGFLYPLYADPDWDSQPENQGNVFAYLVDEFSRIDRSKYHVYQCMVTITRQVIQVDGTIQFPKMHQLIVHKDAEQEALAELSNQAYVIDSKTDI